jgi:hypothetical protein
MDTVVPGGDTAAIVIGQIIQEKDAEHNVIFQWRSWDHFLITDASDHIDLTAHTIDYVHANSIELDYDGNIIVSCRNMDEITKIDRSTGEIIWRMGGKNNQFQFLNHPRGFSYQHDARRITNGNMTIFDNGCHLTPRYTSVLEYNIDDVAKTLWLDWSYSFNNHYSSAMGNAQRLDNGRTFIGWGSSWNPAATEVKEDGTKTFEIRFDSLYYSYRAFRFPWKTNLLTADKYRVDFEYVPVSLSETKEIIVTNNSDEQLEITTYYSRTSLFSVTTSLPVVLEPLENITMQIEFSPDSVSVFSDDIHLRIIKENEMIAQVIKVLGYSDPNADVNENQSRPDEFELSQNYPNPFNPTTIIKFIIPTSPLNSSPYQGEGKGERLITLKVYDVLGNEVATLVNEEKPPGTYEVEFSAGQESFPFLTSGVYFYQLRAGDFTQTRKMLLVK